jgi:AraC family transcriptional regulator
MAQDTTAILDEAADPLERAMAYLEANAAEPLSLEGLAAIAGLSAYHFSRQFTARFGVSPMAHVRARRMALAADQLSRSNAPALVELAFDCGFETQEGFTRAFKRTFGVSPGRFRRAGPPHTTMKETLKMSATASPVGLLAQPELQSRPGFRVAGASGVFNEANRHEIPALWPRLVQRLPLQGQVGWETFGVMWGAGDGGFHYLAAAQIAGDAPAPDGLEVKDIAAQSYLVFRQTLDGSDLHPQMQAAAREIWGERLPKSGRRLANSPDLEVYPADFQPDRAGSWVEWWIPVDA